MAQEQFNDERLQNLARYHLYNNTQTDATALEKVRKLTNKEQLDNTERNVLLTFIDESKIVKPKSMKDMKNEILHMIGADRSNSYSNIANATEIKAIYDYFMANFKSKGK